MLSQRFLLLPSNSVSSKNVIWIFLEYRIMIHIMDYTYLITEEEKYVISTVNIEDVTTPHQGCYPIINQQFCKASPFASALISAL